VEIIGHDLGASAAIASARREGLPKRSHRRSSAQRPGLFQAGASERIGARRSNRREIQLRGRWVEGRSESYREAV
jgi:hypothetical protein